MCGLYLKEKDIIQTVTSNSSEVINIPTLGPWGMGYKYLVVSTGCELFLADIWHFSSHSAVLLPRVNVVISGLSFINDN